MDETTADVRRDIELTRERLSTTLDELEHRLNALQFVRDHPWSAIAVAVSAGVLLSGSGADVKSAAAAAGATRGAGNKLSGALDDVVATLLSGVHNALDTRVNGWVDELKGAISGDAPQRSRLSTIAERGD